jgi:endonuclease/exonuclease/phosphatase family metal-dependent hydrolase
MRKTAAHLRLGLSSLSAAMLVLLGCGLDVPPLGSDDKDDLPLKDSKLAHIAKALSGGEDLTLMELFELGEELPFDDTPDPTGLLEGMNVLDDTRERAGKGQLSVLVYNVALLDAELLGAIPYAQTPHLEERRRTMPGLVFSTQADVIGLQEVWREQDVHEFLRRGEERGYRGFVQERSAYNDGVMVFVREDAIAGGTTPELTHYTAYRAQDNLEFFPGPGIKRGYIEVAFTHASAGPTRVLCTHMQAFPKDWLARMHQGREIGIRAREAPADELVIVLGDMNAGPFYAKDEWKAPEDKVSNVWFENAIAYPMLLEYGDLVDAAILGRAAELADDDVEQGKTVKNDPSKAAKTPMADKDWCDDTPITTFTAWDCNGLYFEQYAATQFPARLDHVHVRARDDLVVTRSEILFTERERFGDIEVEPSDHYAVRVELLVDVK